MKLTWTQRAAAVGLLAAAVFFLRLGAPPLVDPDEARFARTSVEMLRSGDLVVPTFEGRPRLAKPPLLHWLQVASFRVFGVREWAARAPSAVASLAGLMLVMWVAARRFGHEGAAWAGMVFFTMPLVAVEARAGTTDALLMLHVWAALALDMAEPDEAGGHRGVAMGALLGLAFLAKGPVALSVALLAVLAGRTASGRPVVPGLRDVLGFLAGWLAAVGVWVFLFVERLGWDEVVSLLHREIVARSVDGTAHVAPPWYYALVLPAAVAPWGGPLLLALVRVVSTWGDPAARTARYAAAGLLANLLVFSLVQGKRPHYLLPLLPLVAILVTWELGRELEAPRERPWGSILLSATLWILALVFGAAAAVRPEPEAVWVGGAGALAWGAGAVGAMAGALQSRPRRSYAAAGLAAAGALLVAVTVLHPAIGRQRSAEPLVEQVPELLDRSRQVWVVGMQLPSLTFYLDRVPEKVPLEAFPERLPHAGDAWIVLADVDWRRLDPGVQARLEQVARSGKLGLYRLRPGAAEVPTAVA